jgi:hypothetical protein
VLVSVAEWAESEGISHQAANKRIRVHGIPKHKGKIDPEEAKRIFEGTKDVRQQERGKPKQQRDEAPEIPGAATPERGMAARRPEIQTALDAVKLKREQLRLKQLEGSLVDAAEVSSATEARFRADAEALLNWPARVAADLAAELGTDERLTHAALDKYVREFMRERSIVPASVGAL